MSRRPSVALAAALLAISLIVLALAPAAGAFPASATASASATGSASAKASTRIDDRQLKKSTGKKGWTKVSFRKAYKGTLSRTQKAKATAATKVAASNGGSVTFQAGPGRGKFVVTVGKKKKTVKTAGKAVRLKTVNFRGAGKVKLKVVKPGRNGVYIDAVALTDAPVATAPALNAPPASACVAGTSDGGTLVTAPSTPLRICQLPGRVAANMVLQKIPQVAYSLSGPVEVGGDVGGDGTLVGGNAVTLTVDAGVVVIGDDAGDSLFVNRGSRISAIGTAAQPIVFTSRSNLTGGATEASAGLWGGITLLGRGPISDCDIAAPGGAVNCQRTVPNFTAKYGGALLTDSSGTISHVQIRFAGGSTGPGIEGVGLRVAAVGNKTTLDHIQVLASGGDGLSVYGGRANFSSLALTGAVDDVLDTDFGYRGTIQFLVGAQSGAGSGDALVEVDSDGNEDALPRQYARIANATLIGRSTVQGRNMVLVRGGTDLALLNSVVTGTLNCLDIDETGGTTTRAADGGLQDLGAPVFRSVGLACPNAFTSDGNVTPTAVSTIFGSGTNNNNSAHVSSFTGFVNGPNEAAISATDPTAFNADVYGMPNPSSPNRFVATTYVGAIQNATDARFRGWACDTGFANFGSGVSCLTSPL